MLRDCLCSTKTCELLGNPSPLLSRFPSTLGSREIFRPSGMDFPIPPSSWWSTDTINYQSIKKVQYNQVAEEHQKFWLKVCRYLAMAAGRAIARVGYQLYYYPKSVTKGSTFEVSVILFGHCPNGNCPPPPALKRALWGTFFRADLSDFVKSLF